ncbi:MAG: CBS domain-containing protein [Candidatus Omnitrophica bacterium]|nr:CBS domain-containing protein [Candidatus Omnitrophota bacterium]
MKVNELMTKGVETVRPDTMLEEVAGKMKDLGVGSIPVYDGKLLMGMITDRDIVIRSVARGEDPAGTKAGDTMSTEVVTCYEDEDIAAVAKMMKSKKVRRIPVVSRDNELVGMVSLGDIAERGDVKLAEETLEKISEPSQPNK